MILSSGYSKNLLSVSVLTLSMLSSVTSTYAARGLSQAVNNQLSTNQSHSVSPEQSNPIAKSAETKPAVARPAVDEKIEALLEKWETEYKILYARSVEFYQPDYFKGKNSNLDKKRKAYEKPLAEFKDLISQPNYFMTKDARHEAERKAYENSLSEFKDLISQSNCFKAKDSRRDAKRKAYENSLSEFKNLIARNKIKLRSSSGDNCAELAREFASNAKRASEGLEGFRNWAQGRGITTKSSARIYERWVEDAKQGR